MELTEFDQEATRVCTSVVFGDACMTKMAISVDHVESGSRAVMLGKKTDYAWRKGTFTQFLKRLCGVKQRTEDRFQNNPIYFNSSGI